MEILHRHTFSMLNEMQTMHVLALIRDHLQNQQAVYNILKIFPESWVCLCSSCCTCHRKILLEVFGKNSDTPKATVPCCDACCINKCPVSDHRSGFGIAADAIDHLGCYSEVKITMDRRKQATLDVRQEHLNNVICQSLWSQ